MARPANAKGAGGAGRRNLRDLWWHPRHGRQPDGRHGRAGLFGLELEVDSAGIPIVCVPGCPIQPDNLSETILYLLYQATGQAPMIPLDEYLRPKWLFSANRARRL